MPAVEGGEPGRRMLLRSINSRTWTALSMATAWRAGTFLRYDLVQYVTSLPVSYRLKGARSKHILKKSPVEDTRGIAERRKSDSIADRAMVKEEAARFPAPIFSPGDGDRSGLLNGGKVQEIDRRSSFGTTDTAAVMERSRLEGWYRMYIENGVRTARGAGCTISAAARSI